VLGIFTGGKRTKLDDEVQVAAARIECSAQSRSEELQPPDVMSAAKLRNSPWRLPNLVDHGGILSVPNRKDYASRLARPDVSNRTPRSLRP